MPPVRFMLLGTVRLSLMDRIPFALPQHAFAKQRRSQRTHFGFAKRTAFADLPRITVLGIGFLDHLGLRFSMVCILRHFGMVFAGHDCQSLTLLQAYRPPILPE